MKNIKILFLVIILPTFLMAQSVSPEVVSSAGDYYEGANASLSWTLGEISTETYDNGTNILTQGFQQPYGITLHGIDLDLLVFLEGPYESGQMNTDLNDANLIPEDQPYNTLPWNHNEGEQADPIPANAVDWVLIEIHDATDVGSITGSTWVERQAAFVLNDGSVAATDGTPVLQFESSISEGLFVAIWHRNHLGILSAEALTELGGIYSYDFSTGSDKVHGGTLGYKQVGAHWVMPGGNSDQDNNIDNDDKTLWASETGTFGYMISDFNLDTQVNNPDKNDVWVENTTLESQVPE